MTRRYRPLAANRLVAANRFIATNRFIAAVTLALAAAVAWAQDGSASDAAADGSGDLDALFDAEMIEDDAADGSADVVAADAATGDLDALLALWLNRNEDLTGSLPLSLAQLSNLELFHYHQTDLCVPTDQSFRTWLNAIPAHSGTGVDCAAPQKAIRRGSFSPSPQLKEKTQRLRYSHLWDRPLAVC